MGLVLLLILHLTLLLTPSTTKAKPTNGFSVDIFHGDSPLSPFYSPSMNRTEAIIRAAMDSISRSNSLLNLDNTESPIVHPSSRSSNYLMKMSIGLAADDIRFGWNSSNKVGFSNLVFGCGHKNTWLPRKSTYYATGIVGLGISPLSFVSQLSPQIGRIFSYCLPPLYSNSSGKLTFGSESTQSAFGNISTPMVIKNYTYYYVTLDAISVNDFREEANPPTGGNMIVDSGTFLTMLDSRLYYRVKDQIISAIPNWALQKPVPPFKLCYSNLTNVDMPLLTFHLAGGDLTLDESNYMYTFADSDLACVAIVPRKGTSILGIISQIDYKVEYDLDRKTISFGPADCTRV
ncbi:hypothetical protein Fmac_018618 [Flemingia macrophylla]|uniref:Peptidase A1 domain-containing protein n=1 Tax=Flemingia macrophylla TaxID=520843 RepID=A0ABD1M5W3_9FABA